MSYFNSEQREHAQDLANLSPGELCWCGWYRVGSCPNCPKDTTCQDKLDERASAALATKPGGGT